MRMFSEQLVRASSLVHVYSTQSSIYQAVYEEVCRGAGQSQQSCTYVHVYSTQSSIYQAVDEEVCRAAGQSQQSSSEVCQPLGEGRGTGVHIFTCKCVQLCTVQCVMVYV